MLIEEYIKMREGWRAIEEAWLFLLDSVYALNPAGCLLIEEHHKQQFRQKVTNDHFVSMFVETLY